MHTCTEGLGVTEVISENARCSFISRSLGGARALYLLVTILILRAWNYPPRTDRVFFSRVGVHLLLKQLY